ncbi:MAG: CrcB protein [Saprospiraceae bacterium]|jgi:CrcB protein
MVFIGGGLGSICRYSIVRWTNSFEGAFPLATFIANALSCIVLGMLVGYFLKNGMEQNIRLLLVTGFCGGFSTFSTFSYETFDLFQSGDYTNAFANILGSLIVCLFCIFLGIKIIS